MNGNWLLFTRITNRGAVVLCSLSFAALAVVLLVVR